MTDNKDIELGFWQRQGLTLAFVIFAYGLTWLIAAKLAKAHVSYILYAAVVGVSIAGFQSGIQGKSRLGCAGATILLAMLLPSLVRTEVPLSRKIVTTAALLIVPLVSDGVGSLVHRKLHSDRAEPAAHN